MSKRYTIGLVVAFFLSFFLLPPKVFAATYYVAGDVGSDNYTFVQAQNTPTPWKTIQKAATNMVAGDTVNVKGGVTYYEQVTPAHSGTSGNYIVYQAWPGTGLPVIDGNGWKKTGIYFSQVSYIKIIGFYLTNCLLGMNVSETDMSFIKIYNNLVIGNVYGLEIGDDITDNFDIKNNIVINNLYKGLSVNNGGTGYTEDNNLVWNNGINYSNGVVAGTHDVNADPLFVNATIGDFNLKSGSPAIDAGVTLSDVLTDDVGVSRPQGAAYDIGPYEYNGSDAYTSTPAPTPVTASQGAPDLVKTIYSTPTGAISGLFYEPYAMAINKSTNMFYVSDFNSNVVVKYDSSGNQYAGFGGGGQNQLGYQNGRFGSVGGLAVDKNGNVYASDSVRGTIQKFDSNGNFVAEVGKGYGTDNGKFISPRGIAFDSSGNVYIVDSTKNNRVQKFDINGNFLATWGSLGSGNGQFNAPRGISIDLSNNVYIVDTGNNRIQKFDLNGTYVTQWGSSGSGNGKFNLPVAAITDSSNNVYIVDVNNYRIQKFDSNGNYITQWGTNGTGNGQFNNPKAVALDSSGNVYVTDENNRNIQEFTSSGTFIASFFSNGSGDGQLSRPYGLTTDSQNNIYVNDSDNGRIEKFDVNGNFLTKWGSPGSSNGQLSMAVGIAVDSQGNVYVGEQGNNRIQKFDSNGNYVTKWGSLGSTNGKFNNPVMVSVDKGGYVYVADSNNSRVQKFTSSGTFITSWTLTDKVDGVTFDIYGNMFTSDFGCTISKFDSNGNFVKSWGTCGVTNGKFYEPTGVATDSYGNLYVNDYANNRIQEFDNNGNFLTAWGLPGTANGDFNGNVAVAVDSLNRILVADANSNRIQIFGYKQTSLSTSSSPIGGAGPSNPNCPSGWSHCISAGPNMVGGGTGLITGDDADLGVQALVSNTANHDDIFLTITKQTTNALMASHIPFPWSQGINSASEIYDFNAVSAFNGYPILTFDHPATVILPYDPTKLNGVNPKSLRIAWYDPNSKTWKILQNNTVVNPLKHTIANTTTHFSYFVVVSTTGSPILGTKPKQSTFTPGVSPTPQSTPISKQALSGKPNKPKHCFLWFCW